MEIFTLKNWTDIWKNSVRGTVKDNTYFGYCNVIHNHLLPVMGDMQLVKIKNLDLQNFINAKSLEYSKETISKFITCIKKLFSCACDNDLIYKNPALNLKKPISQNTFECEKNVYSQEQVDLIIEYAKNHRFGAEIIVMLSTGIRRCEMLGIKWTDIDFKNKVLHIRRSVSDVKNSETNKQEVVIGPTKNKFSTRDIPLSSSLCGFFSNIPKQIIVGKNCKKKKEGCLKNPEYVFYNRKGNVQSPRTWRRRRYDTFMREMTEYYAKAGIVIPAYNPHQLRHTRASLWVNSDLNLYAIAKVLGHSDLEMLRKRYAHSDVEQLRTLLKIS